MIIRSVPLEHFDDPDSVDSVIWGGKRNLATTRRSVARKKEPDACDLVTISDRTGCSAKYGEAIPP